MEALRHEVADMNMRAVRIIRNLEREKTRTLLQLVEKAVEAYTLSDGHISEEEVNERKRLVNDVVTIDGAINMVRQEFPEVANITFRKDN